MVRPYHAGPLARSDQLVVVDVGGGRGPRRDTDLVEDVLEVSTDGVFADDEFVGDLAVGLTGGDQCEHLDLACGQDPGGCRGGPGEQRVQPVDVGCRAQLLECVPGGVDLELCGIPVAELAAGEGGEQARPGMFVRGLETGPRGRCLLGVVERCARVATMQAQGGSSLE